MHTNDPNPAAASAATQPAISMAWLARRLFLWVFLVALGVAGSCLLYDSRAPPKPTCQPEC